MILVFVASLVGMNPMPVRADLPAGILEDFETGFAGSHVGDHADWLLMAEPVLLQQLGTV